MLLVVKLKISWSQITLLVQMHSWTADEETINIQPVADTPGNKR